MPTTSASTHPAQAKLGDTQTFGMANARYGREIGKEEIGRGDRDTKGDRDTHSFTLRPAIFWASTPATSAPLAPENCAPENWTPGNCELRNASHESMQRSLHLDPIDASRQSPPIPGTRQPATPQPQEIGSFRIAAGAIGHPTNNWPTGRALQPQRRPRLPVRDAAITTAAGRFARIFCPQAVLAACPGRYSERGYGCRQVESSRGFAMPYSHRIQYARTLWRFNWAKRWGGRPCARCHVDCCLFGGSDVHIIENRAVAKMRPC